jgi:hypothetical protein
MKRHHQILAGILAAQIVLVMVVFWPRVGAAGGGNPAFPDLEAGDIVALTVSDADGNSIALRQVAGNWVLPDVDDYPADATKVTPVLENIAGLTTSRLVTRTAASHKRLQVAADDFVRRIDFETGDGAEYTLYLGSSPQYGATHFRVEGQAETYLTGDFNTWETTAEASAWVDTSYVSVDEADIKKLTLENAGGTYIFSKDENDTWTMAGLAADETLNETQVGNLAQKAASVSMVEPLGKEELPEYGMDQPNAVVTIETADKSITLLVGAQDPSYVVASSESPYYVRVSQYSAQDLVEKTRDGFLQQPPTPTAEVEGTATPE